MYGFMSLNVYILDQALAPNEKNALYYYLNPIPVFTFSPKLGTIGIILLGTYAVTTDTSILPYEDNV